MENATAINIAPNDDQVCHACNRTFAMGWRFGREPVYREFYICVGCIITVGDIERSGNRAPEDEQDVRGTNWSKR